MKVVTENNPVVTVTHIPTNRKKTCSDTDSKRRNREIAIQKLMSEIWQETNTLPSWNDFTHVDE